MVAITLKSFGGISPKTPPRMLPEKGAQVAVNSGVFSGTLTPIKGLGASVATVGASSQTIYKFGQDDDNPATGWLAWAGDVDVARSQIAGDTEEWTFYTGDGNPKAIRAGFTGSPIHMGLKGPATAVTATLGAEPADADTLLKETRTYTYTYVNKVGGREIESSPAPASNFVDVYPNQAVTLTGFTTPEVGFLATHVRVYRSTVGTFLYVSEITLATATDTGFEDTLDPELLAEELPSLDWLPPPDTLKGLTNLPNGVMAGFSGRDIYFCEPYVPHAWPDGYRQTIDYPVVGLGKMDTTLAVLTKGTPYLIQGAHPAAAVVIQSDVEQACVSKRSIVSFNGSVFYCSPDGLIMMTPGGSKVITENIYTYSQWQALIKPESVHAYHHDMKYIGFYNNGTTSGCFMYDLSTNEFVLSQETATAGYQNLRDDTLYIQLAGQIRAWGEGADSTYTWRSKIFTMPRIIGMACMQVEASNYPVTCRIYADGQLLHTQTVTTRWPFRLPAKPARDWEVELEGTNEIFSVAIAQGMEEIANV